MEDAPDLFFADPVPGDIPPSLLWISLPKKSPECRAWACRRYLSTPYPHSRMAPQAAPSVRSTQRPGPTAKRGTGPVSEYLLRCDYLHLDRGRDVFLQRHADVVGTESLDGLVDLNATLVHLGAVANGSSDVTGGDCTEQATRLA